ncbi:MAG: hypothetical protein ABIK53_01515 [bacterium]
MLGRNNNPKLREELQKITENENNHGYNLSNQINLINDLAKTYPHSIEIVEEAKQKIDNTWRYNCYMFTFDLRNKNELSDVSLCIYKIFPDSQFVSYLIKNHLTEISPEEVRDGDYVIYFEHNQPKHAGKLSGEKVVSKWGTAHRWSHGLYEVSLNCGDATKFFKQITPEQSLKIYLEWANQKKENIEKESKP